MDRARPFAHIALAALFIVAGANHFFNTPFYVSIMPSYLPWHRPLVYLSGVAELGLGALLLWRRWARLAAWGLMATLMAVFPANVHMALNTELYPAIPASLLWLRLPLQGAMLAWAYWLTRPAAASQPAFTRAS